MILRTPNCLPLRFIQDSCQSHGIKRTCELASKSTTRPFSYTPSAAAKPVVKKPRSRYEDLYAAKQSRSRRLANISRQEVLEKQRAIERGDPIRGITTPFITSLDTALPTPISPPSTAITTTFSPPETPPAEHLNHFLTADELASNLAYSASLTKPQISSNRATADPAYEEYYIEKHASLDAVAQEAVSRIVNLANASSKDRTRANVQRIIDTFGRHKTDQYLRPKALTSTQLKSGYIAPGQPTPVEEETLLSLRKERGGPDTGSSEVQIGILTAKIRVLANEYEGVSRNDKVNKRNLRLLLHRRQKLLKYMERRERGSGRWFNMIETLGLTEATWKGQIAVQ